MGFPEWLRHGVAIGWAGTGPLIWLGGPQCTISSYFPKLDVLVPTAHPIFVVPSQMGRHHGKVEGTPKISAGAVSLHFQIASGALGPCI